MAIKNADGNLSSTFSITLLLFYSHSSPTLMISFLIITAIQIDRKTYADGLQLKHLWEFSRFLTWIHRPNIFTRANLRNAIGEYKPNPNPNLSLTLTCP